MPVIQLPIKNFDKQQEIFDCPARIIAVKKGRRFGFTKGAANNTIKVGLNGTHKKGLWVDTVNSNIERYVERYFIPTLSKLPDNLWSWRKQQKILQIRDFYMDFRSVDTPENIEGFGYDYMILNEAGIILKDPYLWHNAIRPMMWDHDCQAFIGGTPKGGGGIFEELYKRGLDKTQQGYASFQVTSFDNPYIPAKVIQEDINSMPERVVRQEIYGEFLEDTGVVFRGVSSIATLEPKDPVDGHLYVIGCDLAKVQDFTVMAVYDRSTNEQVYQIRFNKLEWPFQKEKIKETSKKFNNALVMIDSTGLGEPIADDLSRAGVPIEPIHFTNPMKKQLVEKLSNWIELKNIHLLRLDETINEFNSFTYDYSEKTGRVIYGAPVGFHDDIVFAHALAIWSLQPIIRIEKASELSIIQQDLNEKKKALQDQSEGGTDYTEYEIV